MNKLLFAPSLLTQPLVFFLSFTSESFMALAEVAGDVVHAGPVVQAGVGQALVNVGLAEGAWENKKSALKGSYELKVISAKCTSESFLQGPNPSCQIHRHF